MIRPDLTAPRSDDGDLESAVDELFGRPVDDGVTFALLVQQGGATVVERYGERPADLLDPDPDPIDADTVFSSRSIAKSIVHAAVGLVVGDGHLALDAAAPVPQWLGSAAGQVTTLDLLEMRSGLKFADDPADDAVVAPVGTTWEYADGSTERICGVLGHVVGGEQRMREFLDARLFGPLGMRSVSPRFDAAGTWIGWTDVFATARDFARFGDLYLREGTVGGVRLLPDGWVDHARTPITVWPGEDFGYGRHWWLMPDQPRSLVAIGADGQFLFVLPERDAVIVHLGGSEYGLRFRLQDRLRRVIQCL